jgi:hypothetical protein
VPTDPPEGSKVTGTATSRDGQPDDAWDAEADRYRLVDQGGERPAFTLDVVVASWITT